MASETELYLFFDQQGWVVRKMGQVAGTALLIKKESRVLNGGSLDHVVDLLMAGYAEFVMLTVEQEEVVAGMGLVAGHAAAILDNGVLVGGIFLSFCKIAVAA